MQIHFQFQLQLTINAHNGFSYTTLAAYNNCLQTVVSGIIHRSADSLGKRICPNSASELSLCSH